MDLSDHPLPEAERLCMRIVDAEDLHAALDPQQRHLEQRLPQRAPILGLEIERIDVLVFLRRVLGILDRAVGSMPEPFRMFMHPRMIRRALPREIDRDLEAEALGFAAEPFEILEGAEPRLDRRVAAVRRSDRPWTPGITWSGDERIVAPFAEARADRMNGRQIDDVEPEIGDARQAISRLAERAAPRGIGTGGSREHLVPAAEARAL